MILESAHSDHQYRFRPASYPVVSQASISVPLARPKHPPFFHDETCNYFHGYESPLPMITITTYLTLASYISPSSFIDFRRTTLTVDAFQVMANDQLRES
jgi:hypothetical protein